MKKFSIFAFAVIFSMFAISCNNGEKDKEEEKTPEEETKAQIVDLESFNEAYETLEFETCDEYGTAVDHYAEVYFSTLDKAVEGDEDAIAEFKELHQMRKPFEEQAKKLEESCPDFMTELEEKYEGKLENRKDDIDQIVAPEDTKEEEDDLTEADEEVEIGEDKKAKKEVKKQDLKVKDRGSIEQKTEDKQSTEEDQDIEM
ncbi:MAG: hypothetical protein ACQES1_10195 [Bacteroidota bacterium]